MLMALVRSVLQALVIVVKQFPAYGRHVGLGLRLPNGIEHAQGIFAGKVQLEVCYGLRSLGGRLSLDNNITGPCGGRLDIASSPRMWVDPPDLL
jgi:hypothetical protein